jgi:uncharacterized protein (UPF0264 family)
MRDGFGQGRWQNRQGRASGAVPDRPRSDQALMGHAQHQTRPLLLVSVRDGAEAEAAVAGGADILDVKEPAFGPLGRADATAAATAAAVAAEAGLSWTLACGELVDTGPAEMLSHLAAIEARLASRWLPWGLKLGLSLAGGTDWRHRLSAFAAALAGEVRLVAVGYADAIEVSAPSAEEVVDAAGECGAAAVLVDTFHKRPGGVLGSRGAAWLGKIVQRCRATGLPVAVAGGLAGRDLPAVAAMTPDVVALRTAACRGGRDGVVAPERVAALRSALGG